MSAYPTTFMLAAVAEQKQRQLRAESRLWRRARTAEAISIGASGFHWTDFKRVFARRASPADRFGLHRRPPVSPSTSSQPAYQA